LVTWVFINEDAINDSAPTGRGLREEIGTTGSSSTAVVWNENSREELMEAVVDESKKRRRLDDTASFVPIDWSIVAKRMGNGSSALDCERVFLSLPLEAAIKTERSITPDAPSNEKEGSYDDGKINSSEKTLKDIVDSCRPEVIKAATDAALKATDNLAEAQKAAVFALVASEAAVHAREEEDAVSRLLVELQEQRLQKLESRLALLDDIEGVLEPERVALELDRRNLNTACC
jgi:SWI/SNF related-matrix-associated actin-dependent regulator of chromatin subfamily C